MKPKPLKPLKLKPVIDSVEVCSIQRCNRESTITSGPQGHRYDYDWPVAWCNPHWEYQCKLDEEEDAANYVEPVEEEWTPKAVRDAPDLEENELEVLTRAMQVREEDEETEEPVFWAPKRIKLRGRRRR